MVSAADTRISSALMTQSPIRKGWNHSGFFPVSRRSRKTRENPGMMIPSRAETSVHSATKATAAPAPLSRLLAKASMLLGLPPGWKEAFGANRRQIPVKELSKVSMGTV